MSWTELPNDNKLKVLDEVRTQTGFPLFIIEKDWWVVQVSSFIAKSL